MSKIINELDQLRDAMRELSQNEISRRTGIGQSKISQFIAGKSDMNGKSIAKIMNALGLTFAQLVPPTVPSGPALVSANKKASRKKAAKT